MGIILSPSLLAADFSCLDRQIAKVEEAGAQWLHLDIMDFHFVPNLTFGSGVVKFLRPLSKMVFDAHFMVEHPETYIEPFAKVGADYFTFHYEAVEDPQKIIDLVKEAGMKCGISVKPKTDVKVLEPYLSQLDLVLVMSVEPGFGGQSFLPSALPKLKKLRAEINRLGLDIDLDDYADLLSVYRNNVIVTPHTAGVSKQAIERMDYELANKIIKYLKEEN